MSLYQKRWEATGLSYLQVWSTSYSGIKAITTVIKKYLYRETMNQVVLDCTKRWGVDSTLTTRISCMMGTQRYIFYTADSWSNITWNNVSYFLVLPLSCFFYRPYLAWGLGTIRSGIVAPCRRIGFLDNKSSICRAFWEGENMQPKLCPISALALQFPDYCWYSILVWCWNCNF